MGINKEMNIAADRQLMWGVMFLWKVYITESETISLFIPKTKTLSITHSVKEVTGLVVNYQSLFNWVFYLRWVQRMRWPHFDLVVLLIAIPVEVGYYLYLKACCLDHAGIHWRGTLWSWACFRGNFPESYFRSFPVDCSHQTRCSSGTCRREVCAWRRSDHDDPFLESEFMPGFFTT